MRHKPFARGVSHLMYVGDDEIGTSKTALVFNASMLGGLALVAVGFVVWTHLSERPKRKRRR